MNYKYDNAKNISTNKINFLQTILNDDKLYKCIKSNQSDFLNYNIKEEESRADLIYDCVFPYPFQLNLVTEEKTFITLGFKYEKDGDSSVIKEGVISVHVFCHKNLVRTDYECLRYDYIEQRLLELFNNSKDIINSFGRLIWIGTEDFIADEIGDYVGCRIIFTSKEKI